MSQYKDAEEITSESFVISAIERWLISSYMLCVNKNEYEKYIHVSYDKLVENPERELKRICQEIEIDYSDKMLTPTYCQLTWHGNSSKGSQPNKINKRSTEQVSEKDDHRLIKRLTGDIEDMITSGDFKSPIKKIEEKFLMLTGYSLSKMSRKEIRTLLEENFKKMRKFQYS